MKKILYGLCALTLIATSCSKNSNTPSCDFRECSQVAPTSESAQVESYLASVNITNATKHCSGAYYVIDAAGSGSSINACSRVNATYTGKLSSGSTFDSGTADLPLSNVIVGWRALIPLIKSGGQIRIFIPPSLAYGTNPVRNSAGAVVIPGNSILVFDIKVNSVL